MERVFVSVANIKRCRDSFNTRALTQAACLPAWMPAWLLIAVDLCIDDISTNLPMFKLENIALPASYISPMSKWMSLVAWKQTVYLFRPIESATKIQTKHTHLYCFEFGDCRRSFCKLKLQLLLLSVLIWRLNMNEPIDWIIFAECFHLRNNTWNTKFNWKLMLWIKSGQMYKNSTYNKTKSQHIHKQKYNMHTIYSTYNHTDIFL